MIDNSNIIAIAMLADRLPDRDDDAVDLQILETIKGDLKPGKHRITFNDHPRFANKGESFIVFLGPGKAWQFVAHPLNGRKLDEDVLQLDGFYDYNAYFVSPAVVTLNQLRKYLKDKTLVYRFRGDIYFPEKQQATWKAGSIKITGTYDAVKQLANVEGLPNLKGFDAQPTVHIHNRSGRPSIELEYSRQTSRPLILMSKVDAADLSSGEFMVRFAVQAPEVLTQKAFEEYLANPKCSGPYYKFKLACKPTTDEPFPDVLYFYDQKATNGLYERTLLEGYGKTPPANTGGGYNGNTLREEMKTDTGAELSLVFEIEKQESSDSVFEWTFQSMLPYSIYRTSSATGFIEIDGRKIAKFTATLDYVGMNLKAVHAVSE